MVEPTLDDGIAVDAGLAVAQLELLGGLSDQSAARMSALIWRFVRYCEVGHGIAAIPEITDLQVRSFVIAKTGRRGELCAPSAATMHLRRSAVRLFFRLARQAGLCDGDPTIDLVLPPRSCLPVRPLTEDEVLVCRSFALLSLSETRSPAAWALAEATGRTSELPHVRASDADVANRRVWLHGGSKAEPRWGELTEWGAAQMERRLRVLDRQRTESDPRVVYSGGRAEGASGQASSCAAVAAVLLRSGLGAEPDVRPGSVAGWAGARVMAATGRIDEVAKALGMRSLDRAAQTIGWDWRPDDGPSPLPAQGAETATVPPSQ